MPRPNKRSQCRCAAIALLLVLVLAAAGCSSRRANPLLSATGLTSHTLCAGTFISHLDPDQVYAEAVLPVPGFWWVRGALSYQIDRERREVRVALGGQYEAHTVYRAGLGCLLVQRPEDALLPGVTLIPAPQTDASDFPEWPADPVAPRDGRLREALDAAFAETRLPLRQVKAIVIVHEGQIVAERYAPGIRIDTPLPGWSLSKSVINALIGVLVRQGKMQVDAPAPVPAWKAPGNPRGAITLDMLLRQTSGLDNEETGSGFDPNSRALFQERDMAAFAEAASLRETPGTEWEYASGNYSILSRIVRDAVGNDTAGLVRFMHRELFDPAGMPHMWVEFDATGTPVGGSYFFASAREWARLGELFLNDGVVSGRRILPAGWADYSASSTPSAQFGYGAGWWTNRGSARFAKIRVAGGMPADSYFASGALGQRIVVVPSKRLVIVHLALDHRYPDFDIQGLIRLTREVVAAVHSPENS